jgi:3-dehydroquinate synthase
MTSLESLTIHSGQGDYRVDFPTDLSALVACLKAHEKALVLLDENVARLYRAPLAPLLQRLPWLALPATEDEKTLAGAHRVIDFLQQNNATKQTVIIVFGGGIIQDIAAFSAHIYYRGLRWVFVPTTLLAMCDSCIGAKSSINHNGFKNQLGAFYSPHQVLICQPFLDSLSETEIVSGYGEILKLLITGSAAHFALLREAVAKDGLRNPQLGRLIYESLKVKQGVIEIDEYERDLRRILNYGHTFGHALEALTHHAIPHGKAVAWGIDLVNYLALERGLLDRADYETIHDFIRRYFAHRLPQAVSARELIDFTRRDKKVADGKVNLILLRRIGELKITPTVYDASLEQAVEQHLAAREILTWP